MDCLVPPHSEETQMHFLCVLYYFEYEIMVFQRIAPKYEVFVRALYSLTADVA